MKCPYCHAELEQEDQYFKGLGDDRQKLGNIYRCPNAEGFKTKEEAQAYDPEVEDGSWEDVVCNSNMHHVCGSFYDDNQGVLYGGYPC